MRPAGVFSYLAAGCLLLTEITLVGQHLNTEALIAVLALTAVGVNFSAQLLGSTRDRLRRAFPILGVALIAIPLAMGIVLHSALCTYFRATGDGVTQLDGSSRRRWPQSRRRI